MQQSRLGGKNVYCHVLSVCGAELGKISAVLLLLCTLRRLGQIQGQHLFVTAQRISVGPKSLRNAASTELQTGIFTDEAAEAFAEALAIAEDADLISTQRQHAKRLRININ